MQDTEGVILIWFALEWMESITDCPRAISGLMSLNIQPYYLTDKAMKHDRCSSLMGTNMSADTFQTSFTCVIIDYNLQQDAAAECD